MAEFTANNGMRGFSLQEWLNIFTGDFRNALGPNLDTQPESVTGQMVGPLSLLMTQADEIVVSRERSFSIDLSVGFHLEDNVSPARIKRRLATQSTVTATLAGVDGTVVGLGKRVSTEAGDVFYISEAVTISASGTVDAGMRAVNYGAIPALAGTLSNIIDVVNGWTAITNVQAAMLGDPVESHDDLRGRYKEVLARNSRGFVESIRSRVRLVEGVTHVRVVDNQTNAAVLNQGVSVNANSIAVIVEGGEDADIAAAIAISKGPGGTSGDTSVTLTGDNVGTYRFLRVRNVPTLITMNAVTSRTFPGNGFRTINSNLRSYLGLVDVGESVPLSDLYLPILLVPGVTVTTLNMVRKEGYRLIGNGTISTLTQIQSITSGAFTVEVNGADITASGVDLSGIGDIAGAAGVLQAALRAANTVLDAALVTPVLDGSTVTGFTITLPPRMNGDAVVIGGVATGAVAMVLGLDAGIISGGVADDNHIGLHERLTLAATDISITVP